MMKAAVIGVGSMGKNHARVYHEIQDVDLVAVSDVDEKRAKEIAGRYGAKYYTDYKLMMEEEDIDIISVVVPTKLHKIVASETLKHGIHTLVEKPIASDTEEGKELIELSKENGAKFTVGHIERFNPLVTEIKKQVGRLGKIYSIEIHRTGPFPERIRDVGVIVDLGVHDFDLMRFILGSDPRRVYTEIQKNIHTDFEDMGKITMKFDGNSVGTLDLNWLTPMKTREISILGQHGMLKGNILTQRLEFHKHNNYKEYEYEEILKGEVSGEKETVPVERVEPLKLELQSFIECIKEDKEPFVKAEDALEALRMAEAALESAKTKKVVEFD